ncbi:hypothetical protein [Dasania marina]|mgnify:CR=1 FL=1|uniref:hypothetical protein n=1 Tax=Dasania marina TaxID=471499 RepID=UPI00037681AD|nr:hypothetical protein [Dasania marina]|tara:strand:- start:24494 stop:24718 length:225 start_codon:yes stop_codon:yes gene_type:complete
MLELEGQEQDKRVSVQLVSTEAAILAAASRIYAAYISNGSVQEGQEGTYMQAAIKQAAKMSLAVDDFIKAEGEL